jgi:hypothetical protein
MLLAAINPYQSPVFMSFCSTVTAVLHDYQSKVLRLGVIAQLSVAPAGLRLAAEFSNEREALSLTIHDPGVGGAHGLWVAAARG